MSKATDRNSLAELGSSLGWPLLWGSALSVSFYSLINAGVLAHPMWHRYFAGHPVEYVETIMFFVAIAALVLKSLSLPSQFQAVARVSLPEPPATGQSADDASSLLDHIAQLPAALRHSPLGRRLFDALESVERKGTAADLDADLKYLADMDANRRHEGYGFVRIIVWAIPMLGFLGTVMGITEAMCSLTPESLVETPKKAMEGLLGGLTVAFDTTAIGLSFSLAVMFLQFLVDGVEAILAGRVETHAADELLGRFATLGGATDPHVLSIHRMSQEVVQATGQLAERQAEVWQQSLVAAEAKWQHSAAAAGEQLQTALAAALNQSLAAHAQTLNDTHLAAAERTRGVWEGLQKAIIENAQRMQAQQSELIRQGEAMSQVLEATGNVIRLERTLNENLKTLAGANHFEESMISLAAAANLLSARLGHLPAEPATMELKKAKQGRAA